MTTITLDRAPSAPEAPELPERFGPGPALRHALAIGGRDLRHLTRNVQALVFVVFQPVMLVLLFNYVIGGAVKQPGIPYVQYLIPGVVVQTLAFSSSFAGMSITQDLLSGALDRFRSAPIARSAVVLGRIMADGLRMTLTTLVVVAVGVAETLRALTLGGPAAIHVLQALAWIAAITVVFFTLTVRQYRRLT